MPTVREGRCLPYGSGIVYWALGEVLRAEAGIHDGDSNDVAWAKLSELVDSLMEFADSEQQSEPSERKAAMIGRLLGIEAPEQDLDGDDPQRMREAFFSAVRSVIEGMALRNPLVLVFEDVHWADHGMLDLIEYLAQWVRAPLILLCLARDELLERRTSWGGGRVNATSILLDPLTMEQTRELVGAVLPEDTSADEVVAAIAERAGGNPFFAEEMARRLASQAGGGGVVELPDTVQALLAARLDSLEPEERLLVQHAAVVGRTFWEGSLTSVTRSEEELHRLLMRLQEKDIVVPDATMRLAGEREYAFRHVLIRDVAYGMLPRAVRCRKHYEVGPVHRGPRG